MNSRDDRGISGTEDAELEVLSDDTESELRELEEEHLREVSGGGDGTAIGFGK